MKFKQLGLFSLFLLSFFQGLHAEWVIINKDEYIKGIQVAENYFQKETQSCRFRYSVFAGHSAQKAQESYDGFYIRNGADLFSQSQTQLIYQNAERRLLVDNSAKRVVLTIPDTKENTDIKLTVFNQTLSLVKQFKKKVESDRVYYKLEYQGVSGIDYQLVVINGEGLIEEFSTFYSKELHLDPNNSNSVKVKPVVRMELFGYNFQKEIPIDNKIEAVLRIEGGKPTLQGKLKGFELINVLG